jgi:hypothetical protein
LRYWTNLLAFPYYRQSYSEPLIVQGSQTNYWIEVELLILLFAANEGTKCKSERETTLKCISMDCVGLGCHIVKGPREMPVFLEV